MATIATIIPTYRRPYVLQRAIRSVLRQSYANFEIHVYDNCSGDETAEVVAELAAADARVKYHCHSQNIGMMRNFAFGISRAETPLMNILSDDDILLPGFFQAAVEQITVHPTAGFFFGGLLFCEGRRVMAAPVEHWEIAGLVSPEQIFKALFPGSWITWTSCIFRTLAIGKIGGLRPELGYGADVDLLLRLAVGHSAFVTSSPCAAVNLHRDSGSIAMLAEEYSARKVFHLFQSVEMEIGQAEREKAISREQAHAMRMIIGNGAVWRLARQAIAMLAQGHREAALEAAEMLAARLGRKEIAAIARVAAGDGAIGLALRETLRALAFARDKIRNVRSRNTFVGYPELMEWEYGNAECAGIHSTGQYRHANSPMISRPANETGCSPGRVRCD